jgi:hypothetical protein
MKNEKYFSLITFSFSLITFFWIASGQALAMTRVLYCERHCEQSEAIQKMK